MALKPTERYAGALDLAAEIEQLACRRASAAQREPLIHQRLPVGKRHRAMATSAAVAAVLSIAALGVISILLAASAEKSDWPRIGNAACTAKPMITKKKALAQALRADKEAANAEVKAKEAVRQEKEKSHQLDRAEHLLYVSNIFRAQQSWNEDNAAPAHDYLDATRWDYRGWEHSYLAQLFQQNQHTLRGHTSEVRSVSWSPDGKRLASGSGDNTIKVWDSASGQEALTLRGHTEPVNTVSWSPDGKRLASGSDDMTIKIWDAASSQETCTIKEHSNRVTYVSWSPDSQRKQPLRFDSTIKVWDVNEPSLALRLESSRPGKCLNGSCAMRLQRRNSKRRFGRCRGFWHRCGKT